MSSKTKKRFASKAAAYFSSCSNCDADDETLYTCTLPDCARLGEPFCLSCGKVSHKKKDHRFDPGMDYTKEVELGWIKQNIFVKYILHRK